MSRVFIITGTRKGIGRDLCLHYLNSGHRVVGCSRGESSLDHPEYLHYCLDVSEEKDVIRMVRETYRKHGQIDVLINNAGIASMNHISLSPTMTAHKIFNTNYIGSFIFLREVAKIMMKKKYGRIINFATVATPLKLEGEALYASSKAAIESLTKIAAREFGEWGITVNAIGPTPVPTDLIRSVPEAKMKALLGQQAIKRFGTVRDISNLTDFLIQDSSEFITGQIIYLGGVTS